MSVTDRFSNYRKSHIPKRFWELTLDDYDLERGGEKLVKEAVAAYIKDIDRHLDYGTGLTLSGPPGIGKTMLMCVIGMAAVDEGYSVLYCPLAKYYRWLLNLIDWRNLATLDDEYSTTLRLALKARNKVQFLLLDDVGKEHQTATRFSQDEFDFLVRLRFDKSLPTLITTNEKVEGWYRPGAEMGRYTGAMQSFAAEAFPEIHWEAQDFRGRW